MPCPLISQRKLSQIATKLRNSWKFSPSKTFSLYRYVHQVVMYMYILPMGYQTDITIVTAFLQSRLTLCRCLCIVPGLHCTVNSKLLPGLRNPISPLSAERRRGWEEWGVCLWGEQTWRCRPPVAPPLHSPAPTSGAPHPHCSALSPEGNMISWDWISLVLPGFCHAVFDCFTAYKNGLDNGKGLKGRLKFIISYHKILLMK